MILPGTGVEIGRAPPRHLLEITARPFLPQPRQRSRPLRSSTLAAGLSPARTSASGVSSATWWQAARMRQGSLFADKLVVADPGAADFKIVSDLVIITRRPAEQRL